MLPSYRSRRSILYLPNRRRLQLADCKLRVEGSRQNLHCPVRCLPKLQLYRSPPVRLEPPVPPAPAYESQNGHRLQKYAQFPPDPWASSTSHIINIETAALPSRSWQKRAEWAITSGTSGIKISCAPCPTGTNDYWNVLIACHIECPASNVPATTTLIIENPPPAPPPTATARTLETPEGTTNDPLEVKVCKLPPQTAAFIKILNYF